MSVFNDTVLPPRIVTDVERPLEPMLKAFFLVVYFVSATSPCCASLVALKKGYNSYPNITRNGCFICSVIDGVVQQTHEAFLQLIVGDV